MSDHHVPPPPKPPVYKTYAERKEAEDRIRAKANRQTHNDYKLPPVPAPGSAGKHSKYKARPDPVPSADGTPTRDMEPVKIPLKRKIQGDYADVLPFNPKKKEEDT